MNSLFIAHRPGRTTNETGVRSCRWHRVIDALPMGVPFPPLDIGIQAIQALTLLLRRCRATVYTSSAVPRFTYRLLFPFPFGSRLVVSLGVICPELRPPQVAILSVRDTAHSFPAHGSSLSNALSPKTRFSNILLLDDLHDTHLLPMDVEKGYDTSLSLHWRSHQRYFPPSSV
jgi:hypothetical protein